MRTIKFRVWDKEDRVMIVSCSFYEMGISVALDGTPIWNEEPVEERLIVLQYTGLKDKNGKEIYEGDILVKYYKRGGKETSEVFRKDYVRWGVYDIGCNGFEYTMDIVGPYVKDENLYCDMIWGEVKVLGNIYENKELLNEID